MQVNISAPSFLPAGVYGSRAYVTSTPKGKQLNIEYDHSVDPLDCAHPITVGSANLL